MIETFNCPSCSTPMELDSGQFGQPVQCPACQAETIPERPKRFTPLKPEAMPKPRPRQGQVSKFASCEICGEQISPGALMCPKCGDLKNTWAVAWKIVGVFGSMQIIWAILGLIIAGVIWLAIKFSGG